MRANKFSKNIIQSGCLNYPIAFTCFNKQEIKWSVGKEISHWRDEVLKAGVKGWMPYVRENQYKEKILFEAHHPKFQLNLPR